MSAANFRNIAVIGAGTMGSGIAAQIANAGHDVLLLDLGVQRTWRSIEPIYQRPNINKKGRTRAKLTHRPGRPKS